MCKRREFSDCSVPSNNNTVILVLIQQKTSLVGGSWGMKSEHVSHKIKKSDLTGLGTFNGQSLVTIINIRNYLFSRLPP